MSINTFFGISSLHRPEEFTSSIITSTTVGVVFAIGNGVDARFSFGVFCIRNGDNKKTTSLFNHFCVSASNYAFTPLCGSVNGERCTVDQYFG